MIEDEQGYHRPDIQPVELPNTVIISKEISSIDLFVRGIEDSIRRLESYPATDFTPDQQEAFSKLQLRLFDLTK